MSSELTDLPIKFQDQIIPGVMGQVIGDHNYNILSIEHELQRKPQIENKIRSLFYNIIDPAEQGIAVKPGQNYLDQGYIEYEIINFSQQPQPPPLENYHLPFNIILVNNNGNPINQQQEQQQEQELTGNIYSNIPIANAENIPENVTNAIVFEPFQAGNIMANFHNESKKGRYYKKSTFNNLVFKNGRKENPFTRKKIEKANVRFYRKKGGKSRKYNKSRKLNKAGKN